MWKHYDNPFGKSYGLLARDKNIIVGARMFMFWEFRKANRVLRAIRPVDTITHPEYRGKGIFKKLTYKGLMTVRESMILYSTHLILIAFPVISKWVGINTIRI